VALPVAAAVVAGDPDVQAHVVAELEQAPLDLGVGGRFPGRDKRFVWRLLGLVGGSSLSGTVTGPMAALSARGRRASLAASTGRLIGLSLASRMAATTAWPSAGFQRAGAPRK
jgi:hypothetical protein